MPMSNTWDKVLYESDIYQILGSDIYYLLCTVCVLGSHLGGKYCGFRQMVTKNRCNFFDGTELHRFFFLLETNSNSSG
jgi:hypothetical protein